ncbi:Ig-like domain-containing protein, partial [Candidatus Pacearchaeota archaeon]|nr:Ig-like domain-containing protein [Candidatus Pacearchaeota archaeon]
QVNFSPGPPLKIELIKADPSPILANEYDSSLIRVYVTDAAVDGEPVLDGVWVTFDVNTSVLFANGTKTSDAIQTVGGYAEVQVIGYDPGIPDIKVTAGDNASTIFKALEVITDDINPTITETIPANNSLDVAANSTIQVRFSEYMNQGSVENIAFWNVSGSISGNIAGTVGYTVDDVSTPVIIEAVFTPENNLATKEVVTVNLDASNITDLSSLPLFSSNTTFTFTTIDTGFDVGSITLTVDAPRVFSNGTSFTTLRANVLKSDGTPVADATTIDFTAAGVATIDNVTTTTGGVATAQVKSQTVNLVSFTASVDTGAEIIIDPAPADPPVTVLFYQEPVQLSLSTNKRNIIGDGLDSAQLTAGMIDQYSNDVADGLLINYSTSAGVLEFNQVETINGEAEVLLTSIPKFVPSVTVTAWYDDVSAIRSEVQLAFNPGPPDSLFMNISALPSAIPADGTSTSLIKAFIRDVGGNSAKDGLPVTFSINSSIYGEFPGGSRISAPVSTSGGVASVIFTSLTTAGSPPFTATVGSATKIDNPLIITAIPYFINISSSPSTIPANGIARSIITASVFDNTSTPIPAGIVIDFSTNKGTLSATFATITGLNGNAVVEVIAPFTNSTGIVTASWTDTSKDPFDVISSSTLVNFQNERPIGFETWWDKEVAAADGIETIRIEARVRDAYGNTVTYNDYPFDFSIVSGSALFANNLPFQTVTTVSGIATAFVNSTTLTTADVYAESYLNPDLPEAPVSSVTLFGLDFVEPPKQINVITGASVINGDGVSVTTVTAYLQDKNAAPVINGIFVNFSTRHGTFVSTGSRKASYTTLAGAATVELKSETKRIDSVTITAKTEAIATPATTTMAFKPGPPSFVNMSSSPQSIPADGSTETLIKAYIYDDGDNPVKDGLLVTFLMTTLDATFPNGSQVSAPVMTTDGVATITVKAGAATGQPDITAIVGGTPTLENPLDITLVPDEITLVPASANIQGDGISATTLTATLKNAGGIIADANGFVIDFTSDDGSLDVASAETVAGVATATLTSAAARIIHASPNIHASWTNGTTTFTAHTTVDYSPGPSSVVNVTAPVTVLQTGGASTKITATVLDSVFDPISGVAVNFNSYLPTSPTTGVTNAFGIVTTTYTTGFVEMPEDIIATTSDAGGASGSYTLHVIDADHYPAVITVSASPNSVNADDSASYTALTAQVLDAYGNPVYDQFPVTFTAAKGSLFDAVKSPIPSTVNSSLTVYPTAGQVTVYLYSHNVTKRDSTVITAQSLGSVTGETTVFFRPGPAENISFRAQPPVIAADGLSTSDITIYVRDAIVGGTSTSLSATVLTDIKRDWPPNQLVGMYLNPDSTQGTTYKITSNTATTITTAGDMTSVATSGDSYTVSSTGESTGLSGIVLSDTSPASWTTGALIGLNLNPNTSQDTVFRIVDNTATTITVANYGMETVAAIGDSYEIVGDLIKDGLSATFTTVSSVFLNDTQTSEAIAIIGGTAVVTLKSGTAPANPLISAQIGQLVQYARPVIFSAIPDLISVSATPAI